MEWKGQGSNGNGTGKGNGKAILGEHMYSSILILALFTFHIGLSTFLSFSMALPGSTSRGAQGTI